MTALVRTAFHISAAFLVVAALVAAFVLKQKGWESVAEADAAVGMAEGRRCCGSSGS